MHPLRRTRAIMPSNLVMSGGVDIPATKSIPIRPAQFDLLLSCFGFTRATKNQSNFRHHAGS